MSNLLQLLVGYAYVSSIAQGDALLAWSSLATLVLSDSNPQTPDLRQWVPSRSQSQTFLEFDFRRPDYRELTESSSVFERIAFNVKRCREARGMTQAELALKAGVSKPVIGRIESGCPRVGLVSLFKVSQALGLPINGLFSISCDFSQGNTEIEPCKDPLRALGLAISELRKGKGLSLKELSRLSGFSCMTLIRYEAGQRDMALLSLVRIAEALEVSLDHVLHREILI